MAHKQIIDVGKTPAKSIRDLIEILALNDGTVTQEQESNDVVDIDVAFAAKSLGLVKCRTHGSWAFCESYELTDAGREAAGMPPIERWRFAKRLISECRGFSIDKRR